MHSLWEKTLNSTLGDNFRKTNIKDSKNINVIPSNFLVVSLKMRMLSANLIQVSVGGFDY